MQSIVGQARVSIKMYVTYRQTELPANSLMWGFPPNYAIYSN